MGLFLVAILLMFSGYILPAFGRYEGVKFKTLFFSQDTKERALDGKVRPIFITSSRAMYYLGFTLFFIDFFGLDYFFQFLINDRPTSVTADEIGFLTPAITTLYFILLTSGLGFLTRRFRRRFVPKGARALSLPAHLLTLFVVLQVMGVGASVIPIALVHFGLLPDDGLLRALASFFPLFIGAVAVSNFYKTD